VTSSCADPGSDPATGDAGGALASDATNGAESLELPTRPVRDHQILRKVRRLDDPEILQRVLAGLLNLP
jgi:hypothetical protein